MSVVILFRLKPHWLSGVLSSAMVGHQSVEQYPCDNFSCDGEQSYPPVVVAV